MKKNDRLSIGLSVVCLLHTVPFLLQFLGLIYHSNDFRLNFSQFTLPSTKTL